MNEKKQIWKTCSIQPSKLPLCNSQHTYREKHSNCTTTAGTTLTPPLTPITPLTRATPTTVNNTNNNINRDEKHNRKTIADIRQTPLNITSRKTDTIPIEYKTPRTNLTNRYA